MFNVGDVVRVDFGNGEYDNVDGVFVHDDMRVLNGQTFVVVQAENEFNRYAIRPKEQSIAVTDERLRWTFIKEWLAMVEPAPTEPTPVVEDEQVACYDGETYGISQCVMLTEPSEFAGMYARRGGTNNLMLLGGRRVTLLLDEACDLLIDIGGDFYVKAEVDEDDYVMCEGGSCEGEYIWRNDATYVEDEGYYHEDDQGSYFWYHDGDGYYTYEPEEEEGDTLAYHTTKDNGYVDTTSPETLYTIGFEVEKEDRHILSQYSVSDLTLGWAREHDGSLNDETGYELVSPIYDLFSDKLDNDMADTTLRRHINADSSYDCGGHINFGKRGTSGAQLLKESAAYLPLFLALYRRRVTGRWAKMKVDINKYNGEDRYVAFNVQREYIEFRLVSRVESVDNLLWRRDLFRIMANNLGKSVAQVQGMMLDRRSVLHKHLRKVYTEERLLRLVCWYSQFADAMHDTLSVSKTGHGVMLDFFITSLKRVKKRISVGIDDVIGWAQEVSDIISRVDGGSKYSDNVKPLSCEELKFLGK
jgi:hypothetical protein